MKLKSTILWYKYLIINDNDSIIIARYVNIAFGRRPLGQAKQESKNFIGMMKLRFQRNRIVYGFDKGYTIDNFYKHDSSCKRTFDKDGISIE